MGTENEALQHNEISSKGYVCWQLRPDQIPAAWGDIEPFVVRALAAGYGEMTAADVFAKLCGGWLTAFVVARDNKPELLMAAELVTYPQYCTVRVVLLAGKNAKSALVFWSAFEAWAVSLGAIAIESGGPIAQARLHRRLGFKPTHVHFRYSLKHQLQ